MIFANKIKKDKKIAIKVNVKIKWKDRSLPFLII